MKCLANVHDGLFFPAAEDCEFLTPEATLDEHSPKATRTLFLGNLEKEITIEELKEKLEKYGEILVSWYGVNVVYHLCSTHNH